MTQRLKLTKEGFEELNRELEMKQEELRKLRQNKVQVAENEGDAWHDNLVFEQTETNERALEYEINKLQSQIETARLIEDNSEADDSVVKVGSEIRVYMEYSDGSGEEDTFILTGGFGDFNENKVSINSPIGECILGKKAGFEGQYSVNGKIIKIKVLKVE